MRRLPRTALAVLLLTSTFTHAAGDSTRPTSPYTKGVLLSGKVSDDGKLLVADDDNGWAVTNMDTLKGLEGRYITVKCRMDIRRQAIRVLSIEDPSQTKHPAHLGDAAFRR